MATTAQEYEVALAAIQVREADAQAKAVAHAAAVTAAEERCALALSAAAASEAKLREERRRSEVKAMRTQRWANPDVLPAECSDRNALGVALRAAALACEEIGRPVEVALL